MISDLIFILEMAAENEWILHVVDDGIVVLDVLRAEQLLWLLHLSIINLSS